MLFDCLSFYFQWEAARVISHRPWSCDHRPKIWDLWKSSHQLFQQFKLLKILTTNMLWYMKAMKNMLKCTNFNKYRSWTTDPRHIIERLVRKLSFPVYAFYRRYGFSVICRLPWSYSFFAMIHWIYHFGWSRTNSHYPMGQVVVRSFVIWPLVERCSPHCFPYRR